MPRRTSIVLVDDSAMPHSELVTRIRDQPGFHILAALADVETAMEQICATRPDIVLLNLRQRGHETQTLAGALHGKVPGSRVIVMGMEVPQLDIARYLRAGVSGFIMTGASFDTLLDTIHAVALGQPVLPEALTGSLFRQIKKHGVLGRPRRPPGMARLTARERQVADLVAEGLTNRAIGLRLEIAMHTVKSHVHRVLGKLSVNSRLELASLSTATTAHSPV